MLEEDAPLRSTHRIPLNHGDVLLLPTDGIEESMRTDDELFGRARMFDVVVANRSSSSVEITHALYRAARDFAGGARQIDDITAVVVRDASS